MAIPPPNVTGVLHMGHALNGSMQDALVRMNRMRGRNTLWTLGTDHAGIATQAVVEKMLREEGTSRQELGREAFVERVWAWKEEYGSRIVEQYKRLGASLDYERERFTLDEGYVRAVYRVFKQLYDKGYIYRDNYMVNWDPGSHSAISDLEVENREVEDTLYSIDYPVEGSDRVLTVATVRPETMLADTAVAVNPDDERYADLVGQHCLLPLVGRRLPIIADEHVDPEFGTGALKITPGHDPNDFEIGRRHGLEEIGVIGPDGRMTEEAGERFAGLDRRRGAGGGGRGAARGGPAARRGALRPLGPLLAPLRRADRAADLAAVVLPHGRAGAPAIEVGRARRGADNAAAVEARLPRLDARDPALVRLAPALVGAPDPGLVLRPLRGDLSSPRRPPERCGACGGELRQEEDVLDTWFSSALWPFATLGWPDDTAELRAFYPTSFLTTAREILFLWVARMIMTGIEFAGDVPFRDVYVHSVIQARDGRRMSKSLGTGIDPLEEIDVHGADALRFGLLAMSSTQDVRYSDAKVQQGGDLANKLWNASRLILLNVAEVEAAPRPVRVEDRWILSRLEATIASVTAKLEDYDFAHAAQEAYAFFWSELCDWYLEIVKPRLYEGEAEVSATLLWALERVLALLHPIMPFVTEEIWSYHPSRQGHLAVHPFPQADESLFDPEAEAEVRAGIELTRRLRAWRDLVEVPAATVLPARVDGDRAAGVRRPPRPLRVRRPKRGDDREESAVAAGRPGQGARLGRDRRRARCVARGSRRGARSCAPRSRGRRASSATRSSSPGRRPRWSRRSGASSSATAPSSRSSPNRPAGPRGLPRLARADRLEARPGADAHAQHPARHAAAPLRLDPRRRHQRQVLGDADDRGAARGARRLRRRLRLAARGALVRTGADARRGDRRRRVRRRGRAHRRRRPRRSTAASRRSDDAGRAKRAQGEAVTQFELATAAAFVALAAARVEAAVIEAGLGGRLDATNTIPSRVTVLTSIGLDHTEWLGETELEIAAEKLAVLRDHSTLVLGRVSPAVAALAERTAAERGAKLIVAPEDPGPEVRLRAPGGFQRRNFALACAAAEAFLGELDRERAAAVAAALEIPGRLERLPGDPPTFLDAAHNPDGAAALAEALPEVAGERPVVACLAILADKDAEGDGRRAGPGADRRRLHRAPARRRARNVGYRRVSGPSARFGAGELARLCQEAGLPAEAEPDFADAVGARRGSSPWRRTAFSSSPARTTCWRRPAQPLGLCED